jgi:hypothetical protein
MKHILLILSLVFVPIVSCWADNEPLFFFFDPYGDPLAQHDEYGLLHQSPRLNPTDLAPRHSNRFNYYFESSEVLMHDPAYVGALQVALRDHGYYCGPIDGVYTNRVAEAVMRMQRNYAIHVTGTLNVAVRRAFHLP